MRYVMLPQLPLRRTKHLLDFFERILRERGNSFTSTSFWLRDIMVCIFAF